MSRATAATAAGAAVALTGVLLGSVLVGSSGDDGSAPLRPVADTGATELPLRMPAVAVTITARPSPAAGPASSEPRSGRAGGSGRLPSAATRDAELAAWLAAASLTDPPPTDSGYTPWIPTSEPGAGVPTGAPAPAANAVSADFVISSFNVLGSSHTRGGARGRESGVARMQGAAELLSQHAVDVVGFQELQSDQLRELQRVSPGYSLYPGAGLSARDAENSVAWRSAVWDLVRPTTVSVPYFNGNRRRMPVVLLRHRASGLQIYVANFHNPADTRRYHGQQRWRDQATATEIALVDRLGATGIPVFVTGDMNERDRYFCALTGGTSMVAARGGSHGPAGCDAQRPRAVDWIFGTSGVRFSDYVEDRGPLVDRTTDHPLVVSRATVDSTAFPRAATR